MAMRSKVFRIFVSSTIEYMKLERKILQNEVYDDLSKICEEYCWQIEFVDI